MRARKWGILRPHHSRIQTGKLGNEVDFCLEHTFILFYLRDYIACPTDYSMYSVMLLTRSTVLYSRYLELFYLAQWKLYHFFNSVNLNLKIYGPVGVGWFERKQWCASNCLSNRAMHPVFSVCWFPRRKYSTVANFKLLMVLRTGMQNSWIFASFELIRASSSTIERNPRPL